MSIVGGAGSFGLFLTGSTSAFKPPFSIWSQVSPPIIGTLQKKKGWKKKKRRSIKLHTITNTTPQITHKVLAGRVRWAFDVWHALQAIRCQPTRDLFCCSCLLSVRRCDTKCAYSAHQLPTDGQPDRTTARFTASRAVSMPHFGRRVHMRQVHQSFRSKVSGPPGETTRAFALG